MAKSEEKDTHQVYYIPWNYDEAGGVFGGKIKTRNAIECFVLCAPLAFLEYKLLHFSIEINIIVAMVTILPLMFLSLFGIGGETLSQILFSFVHFRRRRRILSYTAFSDDMNPKKEAKTLASFFEKKSPDKADAKQTPTPVKERDKKSTLATKAKHDQTDISRSKSHAKAVERAEAPRESITHAPAHHAQKTAQKQNAQANRLFSAAMKEQLLRKLELTEDDD